MRRVTTLLVVFCSLCHAFLAAIFSLAEGAGDGALRLIGVGLIGGFLALAQFRGTQIDLGMPRWVARPVARSLIALVLCSPGLSWAIVSVFLPLRADAPSYDRWKVDLVAVTLGALSLWWIFVAPHYLQFERVGSGRFGIPNWRIRDPRA